MSTSSKAERDDALAGAGALSTPPTAPTARPVIAQVMGSFGGGGAERVTVNLARALAQQNVRSICLALREPGAYVEGLRDVEVLSLGARTRPQEAWAALELRRLIQRERIDLLHVHGQNTLPFCALATRLMRRRPRLWFTWHRPDKVLEEPPMQRRLMKWALRQCDMVWGDAQDIIDRLKARLPGAPPMSPFINGVPRRPMTPAQAQQQPVILWMARLVPTKRPEMAIHAVAAMKQRGHDVRMILAGGAKPEQAWYEQKLRDMVRDLGLSDTITMPGWVHDLEPLLAQSNIGLQTSSYEGLSLSLLEQMMAGLAPVASRVGDTAVAIHSPDVGLLFDDGDQASLEAGLDRLLNDVALRQRMGELAHARCRASFSLEAMAERTLQCYHEGPAALSRVALQQEAL